MRHSARLVLLLATLAVAWPSVADVIYDNGAPDEQWAYLSDFEHGQQIAADFMLLPGATVVTDIHWFGLHTPGEPSDADSFTIRIFEDSGGLPAANPLFQVGGIDGNRVDSGFETFGNTVFEYSADIVPVPLLANTTYWLSIVNDTSSDEESEWWAWATSSQSGVFATRIFDNGAWAGFTDDFAFFLTGPDAVVPEPASMTLLGLGLAGVAYGRRKKA